MCCFNNQDVFFIISTAENCRAAQLSVNIFNFYISQFFLKRFGYFYKQS